MPSERTSDPSSVIKTSSSILTPIPRFLKYRPGSQVTTLPGTNLSFLPPKSWVSNPKKWDTEW